MQCADRARTSVRTARAGGGGEDWPGVALQGLGPADGVAVLAGRAREESHAPSLPPGSERDPSPLTALVCTGHVRVRACVLSGRRRRRTWELNNNTLMQSLESPDRHLKAKHCEYPLFTLSAAMLSLRSLPSLVSREFQQQGGTDTYHNFLYQRRRYFPGRHVAREKDPRAIALIVTCTMQVLHPALHHQLQCSLACARRQGRGRGELRSNARAEQHLALGWNHGAWWQIPCSDAPQRPGVREKVGAFLVRKCRDQCIAIVEIWKPVTSTDTSGSAMITYHITAAAASQKEDSIVPKLGCLPSPGNKLRILGKEGSHLASNIHDFD